jgi:hypothetical protein
MKQLTFPLKQGARVISASSQRRQVTNDDVSVLRCVGIIKRPQIQLTNGVRIWQCRLLLPRIGVSAFDETGASSLIVGKEHVLLRCYGEPWYGYCRQHVYDGATVAVIGAAVQRPRYVAIHSSYRYDTEIHVGQPQGFVALVGV